MAEGNFNTTKQIPCNIEAEIGVLNSILIDPSSINYCLDILTDTDFFDNRNQAIYRALTDLYKNQTIPDINLLASKLDEQNKLNQIGGMDYLSSILDYNYSTQNLDSYVTLVKETSLKRKTIDSLTQLTKDGFNPEVSANDYLDKVENEVFNLSRYRRTTDFRSLYDVSNSVYQATERAAAETSEIIGLDTGFDNLNKLTLGLQNGNLIILAARPAMGKSAFALNLAIGAARRNNATVALFSLEMPSEQLVKRMLAADTGITLENLNKGRLEGEEWRLLQNSNRNFSNINIFFDDTSNVTIGDIRSKCRKLKTSDDGLDLVVIDYLQLISSSGRSASKNEEVSQISRGLKLLARELGIPVIALAQLSRAVESREDKRPIMADLRDSGSIEQDADIVAFLYREEYYTHKRPGECDLIVAKNRQGSTKTLKYLFEGPIQKFTDNGVLDRQKEE